MDECEAIQAGTAMLRSSQDSFYVRLRELLRERGVDPEVAALLACWSEDTNVAAGEVAFLAPAHSHALTVADFEYDFAKDALSRRHEGPWVAEATSEATGFDGFVRSLLGGGRA
jgi:hypothetical protein